MSPKLKYKLNVLLQNIFSLFDGSLFLVRVEIFVMRAKYLQRIPFPVNESRFVNGVVGTGWCHLEDMWLCGFAGVLSVD